LTQYIYAAAPTIEARWKLWFRISELGAITEGDADEVDAGYNEPEKAKLARLFDLAVSSHRMLNAVCQAK
jgi:hypothetical protein